MITKKEFLEELQKLGCHKELPTIKDTIRVGTAIKAFNRIIDSKKDQGLLKYIPNKPIESPDNGALHNKDGITKSGIKILNQWKKFFLLNNKRMDQNEKRKM